MLSLFILVGVLLTVESCNLPSQFEAKESVIYAVVPFGSTVPTVSQMHIDLSYDAVNEMIAARGNLTNITRYTGYGFINIDDYPNHLRYTVKLTTAGSRCTIQTLREDFPDFKAWIANATKFESGYYGIGKKKIHFDNYRLVTGFKTFEFTIDEQCMTIDETFHGQQGIDMFLGSARTYNATLGIQDPSVFTIPDICHKAVLVPATDRDSVIGRSRRSIF